MFINLTIKKVRDGRYKKLKNMADILIRNAIFLEQTEEIKLIPITARTAKMLSNDNFRSILTQELLSAKKNISGTAAVNLENLYNQLNLDKYAVKRLRSRRWHIKAKAIQELGIMGQKTHLNKIYRSTNNKNDLVRMEAQTTIVKLYGFEGLRFLDVVSYQISEWQQIKLLQELSRLAPDNFSGIEKWLNSTNMSVIVFALKLVRNYHRFELYDRITELLNHPNEVIRLEAIYTLEKIYTNETSKVLIDKYPLETLKNQKAIVKALQDVGYDDDIPVLIQFLGQDENELKRLIVRTIANINPEGLTEVENLPQSNQYPLDQIIKQIKGELI
ncbi:HEAT repeat domain-containing protein [Pedobacter frigiditerrae]|uniref:HEAT repeat domain-containing protein n=1 Tax=Pedobacter frigiditerrae TaxID=2530452 RepID=A0A4R0MTY3_9SPHI|nr:HEAT repeat domain-containing protein [Pedobacter frigiditerrae]TCC89404.1 HEAT repeat domain-containing protein [Pedobacter frigiditerrae]